MEIKNQNFITRFKYYMDAHSNVLAKALWVATGIVAILKIAGLISASWIVILIPLLIPVAITILNYLLLSLWLFYQLIGLEYDMANQKGRVTCT